MINYLVLIITEKNNYFYKHNLQLEEQLNEFMGCYLTTHTLKHTHMYTVDKHICSIFNIDVCVDTRSVKLNLLFSLFMEVKRGARVLYSLTKTSSVFQQRGVHTYSEGMNSLLCGNL